jgi:hypothetical protein
MASVDIPTLEWIRSQLEKVQNELDLFSKPIYGRTPFVTDKPSSLTSDQIERANKLLAPVKEINFNDNDMLSVVAKLVTPFTKKPLTNLDEAAQLVEKLVLLTEYINKPLSKWCKIDLLLFAVECLLDDWSLEINFDELGDLDFPTICNNDCSYFYLYECGESRCGVSHLDNICDADGYPIHCVSCHGYCSTTPHLITDNSFMPADCIEIDCKGTGCKLDTPKIYCIRCLTNA